jgi:hypothetical protein
MKLCGVLARVVLMYIVLKIVHVFIDVTMPTSSAINNTHY